MKNILSTIYLVIFLFAFPNVGGAQNFFQSNAELGLRAGVHFWGSGDLLIPRLEIEWRKEISDRFDFGVSMNIGHEDSRIINKSIYSTDGVYRKTSVVVIEPLLYFIPLEGRLGLFDIAVGPSFLFSRENDRLKSEIENQTSIGLLLGTDLALKLGKQTKIILRAALIPYMNTDISWGLTIGVYRKMGI
jgi:hypothetical protein